MKAGNTASVRLKKTLPKDRYDRKDINTEIIMDEFILIAEEFFSVKRESACLTVENSTDSRILTFTIETE